VTKVVLDKHDNESLLSKIISHGLTLTTKSKDLLSASV